MLLPNFKIILLETARQDIETKEIDHFSTERMVNFLMVDGCKSIGDRQKCLYPPLKIWQFRIPIKAEQSGSSGGGRVLYYNEEDLIYIYRIFKKEEVDDGKQKRKNIFAEAFSVLKVILEKR